MDSEHILIVEDDRGVAEILTELLEDAGYRVTLVHTLSAARSRLETTDFDLLLCDILLPDGDAELELELELELRSHTACLFMAGHPEAIERLRQQGSHYVQKPFKPAQLLHAIRECLDHGKCSQPAIAM